MAKIRILCIVDNSIYQDSSKFEMVINAFSLVNEDYKMGTHDKISLVPEWISSDFSGLSWVPYNYPVFPNSFGVDFSWIKDTTKKLWNKYFDTIDCVMFFIDDKNWTKLGDSNIYGWNLGQFFNNYQVQLIRVDDIPEDTKLTISMELTHSLNDFARLKGYDFNKIYGVENWDENIVHNRSMWYAGYRKQLAVAEDILLKIFAPRETRLLIIELLRKLIEAYRKRIIEYKSEVEPVIIKKC